MTASRHSGSAPRMLRGLLAVCAVAAPVAALALTDASAAGASTPPCETGGLVIWMNTQGNGTAGTIFYTLNFTNLSGHSCTLRGFPGVSAVKLGGGQLGKPGSRDTGQTVKTITIGNGRTAHSTLGIVDIGALPNCPPTTAAGLRVFPPDQTSSKVIPFPFPACGSSTSPVFLRIRPVTK